MHLVHERMSDAFEKWHIVGLPFPAAIHHFSAPDEGDAHDHPWGFTSHILSGGYIEEVFTIAPDVKWKMHLKQRDPGDAHHVDATHIHRIIELPEGECWTLVLAGPDERVPHFWRFQGVPMSRAWNEDRFQPFIPEPQGA